MDWKGVGNAVIKAGAPLLGGALFGPAGSVIASIRGFIGRFKTKTEAHRAWVDRKTELAFMLKDNMDAIDKRIYYRVINKIFNSLR